MTVRREHRTKAIWEPEFRQIIHDFISPITGRRAIVIGTVGTQNDKVDCICGCGRLCQPSPRHILAGHGMCIFCVGLDPVQSEANFRRDITKQFDPLTGRHATVDGSYRNANTPVDCTCPYGHECHPRPKSIQRGNGMCSECAGNNFIAAEANFHLNITARCDPSTGRHAIVNGKYLGAHVPAECTCPFGHKCWPRPNGVQQGHNMCLRCVGQDPIQAKEDFYRNITERYDPLTGRHATVDGKYINNHMSVECTCQFGHKCWPRPGNILSGQGMCLKCAERDPVQAETNFYRAIISQIDPRTGNSAIVNGYYMDAHTPVECKCPYGHTCYPTPTRIQQGREMCSNCRKKTEGLVEIWLSQTGFSRLSVYFDWCRNPKTNYHLPFDFVIVYNNVYIIIEMDGPHHFYDVGYSKYTANTVRQRDVYKALLAIQRQYAVIRIQQEEIWNAREDITAYLNAKLLPFIIAAIPGWLMYVEGPEIYQQHYDDMQLRIDGVIPNELMEEDDVNDEI